MKIDTQLVHDIERAADGGNTHFLYSHLHMYRSKCEDFESYDGTIGQWRNDEAAAIYERILRHYLATGQRTYWESWKNKPL